MIILIVKAKQNRINDCDFIQARSEALQTFVIAFSGPVTYLPTEKAVKGGGYSAVIQSGMVGPKGGQIMVERTVQLINEMF